MNFTQKDPATVDQDFVLSESIIDNFDKEEWIRMTTWQKRYWVVKAQPQHRCHPWSYHVIGGPFVRFVRRWWFRVRWHVFGFVVKR
jgi:hypothetical protein